MSPVEPAVPERDIDLVLVTGAGASRSFGVNHTQLPLMHDWSAALVTSLRQRGPGFLEATGLHDGMGAEAFEAQLGRFLRSVEGFRQMQPLLEPIASIAPAQSPRVGPEGWQQWHGNAQAQLEEIIAVIHRSLYDLFAAPSIDPGLPHQAYASLFHALGVAFDSARHPMRWVYATTNYDRIGELAISLNGGLPDVGEITFDPAVAARRLHVDGLLGGIPRYVPVLHLHGSVGWFLREGTPFALPVTKYERTSGTPIIMLPDLEKSYENVGIISTIWQHFEEALSRAKRVLVLGHSLHDQALIRAIRANVDPELVAVTYLSDDTEPADIGAEDLRNLVEKEIPGAVTLPMRFEAGRDFATPQLLQWRDARYSLPVRL